MAAGRPERQVLLNWATANSMWHMRHSIALQSKQLPQGLGHTRAREPHSRGLLEHWAALVAATSSVVEPAGHFTQVDRMVPPGP
jgi:hypothetical protein